jgi:hypothetical protein
MNELDVHLLGLILWTDMMRLGEIVAGPERDEQGKPSMACSILGVEVPLVFC